MVKKSENKLNVAKIEYRKWEDLDIESLAQIIAETRRNEGLGDYTDTQMEEYLRTMNERFPIEIAALAIEHDKIVGWIGIERVTENIGEVGRWQPFVVSKADKQKIAKLLISRITDYAKSNDMTRVEVAFGGISEDNIDTFKTRSAWFEAAGWSNLEDTNFMVSSTIEIKPSDIQPPDGFDIRPLLDFDNDAIFECYQEAFITGDARWIYDMTEKQRRQEFDKIFDRSHSINEAASFVVLSEGSIVGFILIVTRSAEEEHLESLGIHPKFRGNQLGRILLSKSMNVLRNQEAENLTLGADPVNQPAIRLYEQFGFETVSRTARFSWKTGNP